MRNPEGLIHHLYICLCYLLKIWEFWSCVCVQMDLMPFVNKAGCECLNESDDCGFDNCLVKDSSYLESDCDEQVGAERCHLCFISLALPVRKSSVNLAVLKVLPYLLIILQQCSRNQTITFSIIQHTRTMLLIVITWLDGRRMSCL